jgi:hypothetical protein
MQSEHNAAGRRSSRSITVRTLLLSAWFAMLASLSACGGGRLDDVQPAARQALASTATSQDPFGGFFDKDTVSNELLDFGEQRFPQYFPGHGTTGTFQQYLYRFYPTTGVYLGVDQNTGGVYVMGGPFGAAPTFEGALTDFITPRGANLVNVGNAWHNLLTVTASWQTNWTTPDGRKWVFTVSTAAGPVSTFALTGASGSTTLQTSSFSVDGVSGGSVTQTLFRNGDALFGIDHGDGGCSTVAPLAFGPPSGTAAIGNWADLGASEDYNTCSPQAASDGTTRNMWSLQKDGADISFFCISALSKDASGQSIGDEEDCIEVWGDGTLGRRAKITINIPGVPTITSRNF